MNDPLFDFLFTAKYNGLIANILDNMQYMFLIQGWR